MRLGYDPLTADTFAPRSDTCDSGYRNPIFQSVTLHDNNGANRIAISTEGCYNSDPLNTAWTCKNTERDIFEVFDDRRSAWDILKRRASPDSYFVPVGIHSPAFESMVQTYETERPCLAADEFINTCHYSIGDATFVFKSGPVGVPSQRPGFDVTRPTTEFKTALEALPEPHSCGAGCYLPNASNGDESKYTSFFNGFGTHYIQSTHLEGTCDVIERAHVSDDGAIAVTKLVASGGWCNVSSTGTVKMASIDSCEMVDIAGSWTGSTDPASTEVCAEWQLRTGRAGSLLPITSYVSSACTSPRQECSYTQSCEYDTQRSSNSTPCDDGLLSVSHPKLQALERLIRRRMAAAEARCDYLCPGTEREIECEHPPPPPPSPPPPPPPPPPSSFLSPREKWIVAGIAVAVVGTIGLYMTPRLSPQQKWFVAGIAVLVVGTILVCASSFFSAQEKWTIAGVAGVAGIAAAIVVTKRGCNGNTGNGGKATLEQPLNAETDIEFTS